MRRCLLRGLDRVESFGRACKRPQAINQKGDDRETIPKRKGPKELVEVDFVDQKGYFLGYRFREIEISRIFWGLFESRLGH